MPPLIKRFGFVRRSVDVPPDRFADAWRRQTEGQLERSAAGPMRLVHCVVRDRHGTAPWHGVSIEWFDGVAAAAAFDGVWADGEALRAAPPVVVTERYARGDSAAVSAWRAAADGVPAAGAVLIGFIQRAPAMSRAGFAEYWWAQHRPLADTLVPPDLNPSVYVHNYLDAEAPSSWDGIGEMYETSLDVARGRGEWFESPAASPLVADEERFLIRHSRVVLVVDQYLIVG